MTKLYNKYQQQSEKKKKKDREKTAESFFQYNNYHLYAKKSSGVWWKNELKTNQFASYTFSCHNNVIVS